MQSFITRSAAAALVAVVLAPAAFAQSASRGEPTYDPYAGAQKSAVCTQLELNAGVRSDECGQLTLNEIVALKADRDNSN
jgi:hypothetical protein